MPDFDLDAALGGFDRPVLLLSMPNSRSAHDFVAAMMSGGWKVTLNLDYVATGVLKVSLPPGQIEIMRKQNGLQAGFFPWEATLHA